MFSPFVMANYINISIKTHDNIKINCSAGLPPFVNGKLSQRLNINSNNNTLLSLSQNKGPPRPPLAAPWPKNPVPTCTPACPPTCPNSKTAFGYRIPAPTLSFSCWPSRAVSRGALSRIASLTIPMLGLLQGDVSSWSVIGSRYIIIVLMVVMMQSFGWWIFI